MAGPAVTPGYVRMMAAYGCWQNDNLAAAAETLTDAERRAGRGAFFGSIQRTFSHLLWADQLWMSRFAGTPKPEGGIPRSGDLFADWMEFKSARSAFDETIIGWAAHLDANWLDGDLTWFSGAAGHEVRKPKPLLIVHFFNHQTHHRGQVHTMLTAAGAMPGDTDLFFLQDAEDALTAS